MKFLIVENGYVTNVVEADEAFADAVGAKPTYAGAAIGDRYAPPPPEPTIEETLLELTADQEYRLCMIELGLK